ncbi:MAG: DUF561 domain-containing protein [Gloeomargarita sp. SKYG116]|nr:DUF561 domain-containing protein [Gloeomargarita sp. SKYG116]MDW8400502.1 DUF561 domain-containing protein [Gloeomargarita sp. SKYGB_i_bin116]
MALSSWWRSVFAQKRAVKIISGITQKDAEVVGRVVRAATRGGATYVDIAADPLLVALAKSLTDLPVCVSTIDPSVLPACVAAGADMVEIGNFDPFYAQGEVFDVERVQALTAQARELLPDVPLTVTVPHTLPLDVQADVAQELVRLGADVLQTEGSVAVQPQQPGILGLLEKAVPALAAAYTLSRAVNVPVVCASGLSAVTAPLALAAGAAGVGIGRAVNRLSDEWEMTAAVRAIVEAVSAAVVPECP